MKQSAIVDARKGAERAVKDMPDGPLKIKAFEVILARLLEEGTESRPGELPRGRRVGVKEGTRAVPDTAAARVLLLREEGYLDEQRTLGDIKGELQVHGWVYPLTSLSGVLQTLVRKREVRRLLGPEGKYRYVRP